MWDHVQAKLYPPPLPLSPCPWVRDTKGAGGGGRGRRWSSPDSCAPAGFSHGSDPSDMTITLSQLTDHPSFRRTPLSEHQSRRMFHPTTTELGRGRGGGEPRRGGGGWGGDACVVDFLSYLLSEKKLWGRYTWIPHTSLLGDCNHYYTCDP
jgi:hypothetical protein